MNDSTPDRNHLSDWLGELMDDETPPARRSALEARLADSPAGRWALVELAALSRPPATPDAPDLTREVMRRLPAGRPSIYRQVAAAVVDAWADPAWREELRQQPRAALANRGIEVPAGMRITVVPQDSAALPTPAELTVPLPRADQPAIPADAARHTLGRTEFGWLWAPPWSQADAARIARGREPQRAPAPVAGSPPRVGMRAGLSALLGRRQLAYALTFALALVVVLGYVVISPTGRGQGGSFSGTAVGFVGGAWLWGVVAASAIVGLLYLVRRRGR